MLCWFDTEALPIVELFAESDPLHPVPAGGAPLVFEHEQYCKLALEALLLGSAGYSNYTATFDGDAWRCADRTCVSTSLRRGLLCRLGSVPSTLSICREDLPLAGLGDVLFLLPNAHLPLHSSVRLRVASFEAEGFVLDWIARLLNRQGLVTVMGVPLSNCSFAQMQRRCSR